MSYDDKGCYTLTIIPFTLSPHCSAKTHNLAALFLYADLLLEWFAVLSPDRFLVATTSDFIKSPSEMLER